jgi:hypothetical protein
MDSNSLWLLWRTDKEFDRVSSTSNKLSVVEFDKSVNFVFPSIVIGISEDKQTISLAGSTSCLSVSLDKKYLFRLSVNFLPSPDSSAIIFIMGWGSIAVEIKSLAVRYNSTQDGIGWYNNTLDVDNLIHCTVGG